MKLIPICWALVAMSLGLSGCLGKTTVRQVYFISPKKKTVFVAPPVNHTQEYLLDDRIRSRVKEYFSSETRFGVVEDADDSDLYILIYIYSYQIQEVGDYGFGNREIVIQTGLFVSDSLYRDRPQEKEQESRYYYKDYPLKVDLIDYVKEEDVRLTEERLEDMAIERIVVSIHELMLTGKLPPANKFGGSL